MSSEFGHHSSGMWTCTAKQTRFVETCLKNKTRTNIDTSDSSDLFCVAQRRTKKSTQVIMWSTVTQSERQSDLWSYSNTSSSSGNDVNTRFPCAADKLKVKTSNGSEVNSFILLSGVKHNNLCSVLTLLCRALQLICMKEKLIIVVKCVWKVTRCSKNSWPKPWWTSALD